MLIIAGIVLIVGGLAWVASPTMAWSMQKLSNDMHGEVSHRTGAWDAKRVVQGILGIALGVAFVIVTLIT